MTFIFLNQRRNGDWVKVTIARSHHRLRPAWREVAPNKWFHNGVEKYLVRRWHGEAGKWRIAVQTKPHMTDEERAAWRSPSHLEQSRRFH